MSPQSLTAAQRRAQGDEDAGISVVYTGIVPIVYKAQRALLDSLVNSIGLAFVMIALVMTILLRRWKEPLSPSNIVNVPGGLTAMLPNMFPMVLIFGVMGHMGILVDIGSMMTASVAMGVAVDDTIHFLNWFRLGLARGLERKDAIRLAYRRVAMAMTQTTAIGGLGLFVFALSTFTPTQRFGVLMLTLLTAALLGDLVFLPALLAGPLGRFFDVRRRPADQRKAQRAAMQEPGEPTRRAETPHSPVKAKGESASAVLRRDPGGERLRR
jgi:predicted RND superfamily exporter protein